MQKIAAILVSIAAIQYGVIPPIVDLTASHVFHPDWPPHARFHMVWLLVLGSSIAAYVLVSLWFRPTPESSRQVSLLGCFVLLGFFTATLFRSSYDGSLTDLADPIQVFGIDGNLLSFSFAAIFQLLGVSIFWRLNKRADLD